jgi:hypothetical protein
MIANGCVPRLWGERAKGRHLRRYGPGLQSLQPTVRLEEWQKGNDNPIDQSAYSLYYEHDKNWLIEFILDDGKNILINFEIFQCDTP